MENKTDALKQLDRYIVNKNYNLPSNVIDTVFAAIAQVSCICIKVYYFDETKKSMSYHEFMPPSTNVVSFIEIVFLNGHYDLVVDGLQTVSKIVAGQPTVYLELTDSPCKLSVGRECDFKKEIKQEPLQKNDIIFHDDPMADSSENDYLNNIESSDEEVKGGKRYISKCRAERKSSEETRKNQESRCREERTSVEETKKSEESRCRGERTSVEETRSSEESRCRGETESDDEMRNSNKKLNVEYEKMM